MRDVTHIPWSYFYLGFLFWHLWMTHPTRMRENTYLTNPCTKRKVLSLTKPKGKIYKTKSLGHYITALVNKMNLLWNTISKFHVFVKKKKDFSLHVYCALSTHSMDIHTPLLLYIYICVCVCVCARACALVLHGQMDCSTDIYCKHFWGVTRIELVATRSREFLQTKTIGNKWPKF